MTNPTRPYIIIDTQTDDVRIVRAPNAAQALRHAVRTRFSVRPAKTDDLLELLPAGAVVETAGEDSPEAEAA